MLVLEIAIEFGNGWSGKELLPDSYTFIPVIAAYGCIKVRNSLMLWVVLWGEKVSWLIFLYHTCAEKEVFIPKVS